MVNASSQNSGKKSIKTLLFSVLTLLATLCVSSILWQATTTYSAYSTAVHQKEFDRATNRFISGLFEVLLERLATNNGLQGADPASPVLLAEIKKHRAAASSDFDPGLAGLKQQDFPNKAMLLQELQATIKKANDFRTQADLALTQSRDHRDENLRKNFIPVMTDSVNAALKVSFSALYAAAKSDPQLALLATIKEIGWQLRDFSGKERSIVASSIAAGTALTPEMVAANAQFRARVNMLWELLQHLTYDPGTHPAIIEAMRNAQVQYFKGFLMRADELRKVGAEGAKYPLTPAQYVAESSVQIDALFDILRAASVASEAHADSTIGRAFWELAIAAGLLIIGVAVAGGSMLIVVSHIARPLTRLSAAVQRLAENDTAVEIPQRQVDDELGMMAKALTVFREALIAKKAADEAKATDAEAKIERGRRVEAIAHSFEAAVGEIVDTVSTAAGQLEASAGTLTATAERSRELTKMVTGASEEASTNVQSVATGTEELSSSITEIGRQVQDSEQMAIGAVEQARRANERVSELSKAAARIGDVVELINTIAGQTNLLALNATIEAARAGEAGRGFAVVASEVKALAEQTAKATGEISHQVHGIQSATQDSVHGIKAIGDTIERMSEITTSIAAAIEEQGVATQEMSRNIHQAAQGTSNVTANLADVQRGTNDTGAASSQVLSAARSLSMESSRLKLEVSKFLSTVRAA